MTKNYLFHGSAINKDINNLNDPNGTYAEAGYDLGNALYLLTGVALGGTSSYYIPVTPTDYAQFAEGVA
jgi:hypothetical protein